MSDIPSGGTGRKGKDAALTKEGGTASSIFVIYSGEPIGNNEDRGEIGASVYYLGIRYTYFSEAV